MSDPYWDGTYASTNDNNIISSADVIAAGGDPGIISGWNNNGNSGGINLFDSFSDAMSGSPFDQILQTAANNNEWSAEQAAIQRRWQEEQNQKAMNFSAEQAAMNREWQKMMSDSAHQREVLDLQKAGLNPVLSATGGNGASVGSGSAASGVTSAGAKGDTDESSTGAIASYLAQMLAAQTSILNTQTSAQASLANAQLMADANMYGASLAAAASNYASDMHYQGILDDPSKLVYQYLGEALQGAGLGKNEVNSAAGNVAETYKKFGNYMQNEDFRNFAGNWIKDKASSAWNKVKGLFGKVSLRHNSNYDDY